MQHSARIRRIYKNLTKSARVYKEFPESTRICKNLKNVKEYVRIC